MAKAARMMTGPAAGLAELAVLRAGAGGAIGFAFLFSAFTNLLMLAAPVYMLQIYDRVLVSGSVETLVALSLLLTFLFLLMGLLDHARGRVMARVGARLRDGLDPRVMSAALSRLADAPGDVAAVSAQRDLDALARFWASPVLLALFDAPWSAVFIAALFIFHPWLGWFAIAGGGLLVLAGWANQHQTGKSLQTAMHAAQATDRLGETLRREAEVVRALGMAPALLARWRDGRVTALSCELDGDDRRGRWTVLARTFRLFLQSAMLGLAALLVLRGELSPGAMVAASVLMGRALQPVEQAVAQWSTLARAGQARARLAGLLDSVPPRKPGLPLPRPAAAVEVRGLSVLMPGAGSPALRGISFRLEPGQAMGVIGPSGSGKTTLARAMIGALPPATGSIRLGGAALEHYPPDALGQWIGYLPQRVALLDGTIAENIARFQRSAPPERVIAAARAAAAHEMILQLPLGYETRITGADCGLSGGQIQRIGLARALFGDPVLLVLDEPNASLDTDGARALDAAVRAARAAGAAVLLMAHRPAALQECDLLMVLKEGTVTAAGPRDSVLREAVRNAGDIARAFGQGASA